MTTRRLVSTAVAALALGIRPDSVRKLVMRGQLTRCGRPGRALVDVEELIAYHAQRAARRGREDPKIN